ncbi:hypothetical protein DIPPA_64838 [Diplonema papillatum]|nr:hypothetical protein DIPPA_64838 [Diplonema papillatum]
MFRPVFVLLLAVEALRADYLCPGSPAPIHAHCQVSAVTTDNMDRTTVATEIQKRLTVVDPHNNGTYALMRFDETNMTFYGNRTTGLAPYYVDLWIIQLIEDGLNTIIRSCSESQVSSLLDASTNYCNVHNLYCGTQDGCKPATFNLAYLESFGSCSQHEASACLV